jgi:uncharacterized glyoxalase superfamily protein PhnB
MALKPDMVGITVKDIARAVAFYRLLGLQFPTAKKGEDYIEVTTPNGYRISLNAESLDQSLVPGWVAPQGQRMGLAFLCDSPGEVDATYKKIVNAGHHGVKEPWDAFWGQRYAIVSDPDGAHISLFAPLAKR